MPAAGYPFHTLAVAGIDRRNPLRAARAVLLAARATASARKLLRRIGADAVLGGGGYVAGPVGLAARSLGLPLALTEADSHLGVANRMLAPLARARLSSRSRSRAATATSTCSAAARCRPAPARPTASWPASASASRATSRACSCSAARSARGGSTRPRSTPSAPGRPATCCTPAAAVTTPSCAGAWTSSARPLTTASSRTSSRSPTPWRPRTWSSRAPAARCSSWRPPACPRCSCPIRTPPPITRRRTRSTWSARARPWSCRTPSSTGPGWRTRWPRCSATRPGPRAMGRAAREAARPDAADRIADGVLELLAA